MLAPGRRAVPQALSPLRRKVPHYLLLHKAPADNGLDSHQWIGPRAQSLIQQKWGIHLGLGRIYLLFHTLSNIQPVLNGLNWESAGVALYSAAHSDSIQK